MAKLQYTLDELAKYFQDSCGFQSFTLLYSSGQTKFINQVLHVYRDNARVRLIIKHNSEFTGTACLHELVMIANDIQSYGIKDYVILYECGEKVCNMIATGDIPKKQYADKSLTEDINSALDSSLSKIREHFLDTRVQDIVILKTKFEWDEPDLIPTRWSKKKSKQS